MISKKEAIGSLKQLGKIIIGEQHGSSKISSSLYSPDYETVLDFINQPPTLDKDIEEALEWAEDNAERVISEWCCTVKEHIEADIEKDKYINILRKALQSRFIKE